MEESDTLKLTDKETAHIEDTTKQEENDDDFAEVLSAETTKYKGHLPEEMKKLKNEIYEYGTDIIDNEGENSAEFNNRYANRSTLEIIGHKLYNIGEFLEHYIHAYLSMGVAVYVIKYTNLFYNLFFNDKINKAAFIISALFFTAVFSAFVYLTVYCKMKYTEEEIKEKFELIIPYCTFLGFIGFVFLITSLWPVYYFYSIFIVFSVFWGFIMTGNIINKGIMGNILCITTFLAMIFSYKFIEGPGHTYY